MAAYQSLERQGIVIFVPGTDLTLADFGFLSKEGYESSLPENAGVRGTFRISDRAVEILFLSQPGLGRPRMTLAGPRWGDPED